MVTISAIPIYSTQQMWIRKTNGFNCVDQWKEQRHCRQNSVHAGSCGVVLETHLHILQEGIVLELLQQTEHGKVKISKKKFFEGIRMG
jgi:hypothetical protein